MNANNMLIAFCFIIGLFNVALIYKIVKITKKISKPFYILLGSFEIQKKGTQFFLIATYVIIYNIEKKIGNLSDIKDEIFFLSVFLLVLWYMMSSNISLLMPKGIILNKTYYDAKEISYIIKGNAISIFIKGKYYTSLRLPKSLQNDILCILNNYYQNNM